MTGYEIVGVVGFSLLLIELSYLLWLIARDARRS
jgi:hypothetical protein